MKNWRSPRPGKLTDLQPKVTQMQEKSDWFNQAYSKFQATQKDAAQITSWMEDQYYWGDVLAQLRGALIRSEDDIEKKLSAQKPGVEAGIWIEQFSTDPNLGGQFSREQLMRRRLLMAGRPPGIGRPGSGCKWNTPPAEGSVISLVCRAVDLTSVDPSANSEIAYAVENELKSSTNYFKPEATALTGQITPRRQRHVHLWRHRHAVESTKIVIWAGSNEIYSSPSAASSRCCCWARRAFMTTPAGVDNAAAFDKLNEIYGTLKDAGRPETIAGQRQN